MAGNDPMLCAPCRVGDHRSHTEDGCHSENNFNAECECPVAPMTRNYKTTEVERFEPDIEVRPGEQPTPLSTNENLEPENHIPVMVPFPYGRWVRFSDYERAIARVDPPAAPTATFECGPARPDDGSECAYGVCPRRRDGCSEYCWQHHGSQCTRVTALSAPSEADKALAHEILGRYLTYMPSLELHKLQLPELSRQFTAALAQARKDQREADAQIVDAVVAHLAEVGISELNWNELEGIAPAIRAGVDRK